MPHEEVPARGQPQRHRSRRATAHSAPPPPPPWKIKDVRWGFVFGAQHYGTLVLTLFPTVALGVILFGLGEEPAGDELQNVLELRTYNWLKREGSIPALFAVIVPVVFFIIILCSVEFQLYKAYHRHVTNAVYAVVFFLIAWFSTFVVHIFAQQVSAIVVAEPRPDFWTRCGPIRDPDDNKWSCSSDTSDGFSSFFSGHASSAMVTAVYSSVYLLWSVYLRPEGLKKNAVAKMLRIVQPAQNPSGRFNRIVHELGHGAVMYIVILQIGFAWIVGVSRVIDNRHHIWDVNSGLIVGIVVGTLFGIQTVGVYRLMPKYQEEPLQGESAQATELAARA